ncbi:MAG TPA: hypothetical protein VNA30_04785 [Mycobacteriales bacterium]|nr:hypothetical protein [Mycobacteriales bacterium]
MVRRTSSILTAAALSGALLAGCGYDDPAFEKAVEPVDTLPSEVASLSPTSGQYLVKLKSGLDKDVLDDTVAKIKTMEGVQSAKVKDGILDVEFRGGTTADQQRAVLKQLTPLGTIQEGV